MLFGVFDILILLLSLIFTLYYEKKKFNFRKRYLVGGVLLLFFLVFPYCSEQIELNRVHSSLGSDMIDGFTMIYILFKWPSYWFFGMLELLVLFLIHQKRKALKSTGRYTTLDKVLKEDM